jgi:SAM-dependent methyltransferase
MANINVEPERAREFYDARYLEGYMDDWPAWKKQRVADLLRALALPSTGKVLDFGCGTGVFTEVIKAVLPAWQVFGTELSDVALQLARRRLPDCRFLCPAEVADAGPFDFVFTHHVLEHVTDLSPLFDDMSRWLQPRAFMLHILPCGNQGSLEQRICLWRIDGVQTDAGGRFVYEDSGHLRRLTSQQLATLLESLGFRERATWFANQYWGAISWISDLDVAFIVSLTDPRKATGIRSALALVSWGVLLCSLRVVKRLAVRAGGPGRALLEALNAKAESEWRSRQHDSSGSEMYMFLERGGQPRSTLFEDATNT